LSSLTASDAGWNYQPVLQIYRRNGFPPKRAGTRSEKHCSPIRGDEKPAA
jgi:hypothetical protein